MEGRSGAAVAGRGRVSMMSRAGFRGEIRGGGTGWRLASYKRGVL